MIGVYPGYEIWLVLDYAETLPLGGRDESRKYTRLRRICHGGRTLNILSNYRYSFQAARTSFRKFQGVSRMEFVDS